MNATGFRRRHKGVLLHMICLMLLATLYGCDSAPSSSNGGDEAANTPARPADDASASSAKQPPAPTVVTSDDLPDQPERIVSMAPNVTEILFALGAGERLVGVTRFCDYPAAAEDLPTIGGVVDTDLEAILSRRPDLVVGTSSGADPAVADELDDAGVPYGFVRMDNLEQTYDGIRQLGRFVGRPDRGAALADQMKAEIDALSEDAEDAEADEGPRVLMVYGRDPLIAAGPDTFGHELVALAGGQNVMADADTSYPRLDIEKVISLGPERIIDATMAGESPDAEFWNRYPAIDAVADNQVHLLDDAAVLRPAPRLVDGLKTIRRAVQGRSTSNADSSEASNEAGSQE